jgi:hypothetical protein
LPGSGKSFHVASHAFIALVSTFGSVLLPFFSTVSAWCRSCDSCTEGNAKFREAAALEAASLAGLMDGSSANLVPVNVVTIGTQNDGNKEAVVDVLEANSFTLEAEGGDLCLLKVNSLSIGTGCIFGRLTTFPTWCFDPEFSSAFFSPRLAGSSSAVCSLKTFVNFSIRASRRSILDGDFAAFFLATSSCVASIAFSHPVPFFLGFRWCSRNESGLENLFPQPYSLNLHTTLLMGDVVLCTSSVIVREEDECAVSLLTFVCAFDFSCKGDC